jgi:glutamine synthetase
VVQEALKKHERVIFNGNNYSPEWHQEAEKRGLPNLRNTVDALPVWSSETSAALFERHGVLTRKEVTSRGHIMEEAYCKAIAIEAQSLLGIASTHVLPAAFKFQERVAKSIASVRGQPGTGDLRPQDKLLGALTNRVGALIAAIETLWDASEKAEKEPHGTTYRDRVVPAMAKVRECCDALELVVDDDLWPLPKYREMLFIH